MTTAEFKTNFPLLPETARANFLRALDLEAAANFEYKVSEQYQAAGDTYRAQVALNKMTEYKAEASDLLTEARQIVRASGQKLGGLLLESESGEWVSAKGYIQE